MMLQINITDKT